MSGFFISGTDTEIGKTTVTVALIQAMANRGFRVTAVKPVQTGCLETADGLEAPDAARYKETGARSVVLKAYKPACSPQLAAELEGDKLCVDELLERWKEKISDNELTLVEGAGGLFAPLGETESMIDLMSRLNLPVILVIGNRLGCLNHAILSLEALRMRGLTVAGMILNRVTPENQLDPGAGTDVENQIRLLKGNAVALQKIGQKYGIPLLADIPWSAVGTLPRETFENVVTQLEKHLRTSPEEENSRARDLAFDREHLWHPYTSPTNPVPVEMVSRSYGRTLRLADGRELIDGTSSWWCAMHGYGDHDLIDAVQTQAAKLSHVMFGGLTNKPAVDLGRLLLKATEHRFDGIFYADSGSVAVEVAQKMAIQYWQAKEKPEKNLFLTPLGGYHGDTHGAMSVCDPVSGMHGLFHAVLRKQIFIERPSCRFDEPFDPRSVALLQEVIEARHDEIAALILEPIVQGAGGMWFYHPEYLVKAADLCRRYDILLIADEIATGFGRTGRPFACDWAGIVPDIMTVGKGLTGGMLTLSAVLTTKKIGQVIGSGSAELGNGAFMHGPTFMANPLACAAAKVSLTKFLSQDWTLQVKTIEERMKNGLEPLRLLTSVADVRVLGAIGVVEMKESVNTAQLQQAFVKRGVWIRPFGNLVYLMPPFTITRKELDKLITAMGDVLRERS